MFTYRRRVEFAETDAAGMVHFSMFFRYMEESEHALWRAAGLNIWESRETQSWPRISATFDFKAPLKFQDEFEVHTEMGAATRSTIQWNHTLKRGDVVVGSGSITVVFVKKSPDGSMKSAEIPSDLVARLRDSLAR
jgi:YbgC/YbaW family acyl-CoA thioester hydrolase